MCSTLIIARMDTSDHGLWRPVESLGAVANGLTDIKNDLEKRTLNFNWS